MDDKEIYIPQMLLIGSTGRNSGKTTLAVELIKRWKVVVPIVGLKVTAIKEKNGLCPRGGQGCGACASLQGTYQIIEEKNRNFNKDTSRFLDAGANKVYWIKTMENGIKEAIENFMKHIPNDTLIVCESNSIRNYVKPGCFLMFSISGNSLVKQSAAKVIDKADLIIKDYFENESNLIIDKLETFNTRFGLAVRLKNL